MAVEVAAGIRRGDVFLVDLAPTRGGEIRKTRPCVVVSPDELNAHLRTFLIAPLTTGGHPYPFRIPCRFRGKAGSIVLDQMRAVDRERLARRLGKLAPATLTRALVVLQEMFAP
ncbi:MAG: type II toxin-antitoxin system PemK/MazF family toxin [Acidobacteriia bacterium]|nr:type II toxin-antitoxin system PemK/MazF family toxin [Terriglobia bacterium]